MDVFVIKNNISINSLTADAITENKNHLSRLKPTPVPRLRDMAKIK